MQEADDKLIGAALSHFRIECKLGEGGMGRVYKATDVRLQRPVAIKMLSSSLVHDKQALDHLQIEAIAASSINHPNICTIYEIETFRGQPFIVMEYIDGGTLRDVLRRKGSLNAEDALACFVPICEAMSQAHQKGIIHLDLKPDNIMITRDAGIIKITDFGLARLASHSLEREFPIAAEHPAGDPDDSQRFALTLTGIMGTAAYMSPEQVTRAKIDQRADIFVLGIVLFELLTGRNPFQAEDALATLQNIQKVDSLPIDMHGVPSAFQPIIRSCLRESPDDRFTSVDELLEQIRNIKTKRTSPAAQKWKQKSSNKRRLAAVLAIVLLSSLLFPLRHDMNPLRRWILTNRYGGLSEQEVTTKSLRAYELFKKAQQDYWRYANRDAIEKLQLAVSLDSTFAYAQVLLGMLLRWQDRFKEADRCFERAARHVEKLKGAERLFVSSMIAYGQYDNEKMRKDLVRLTQEYEPSIDALLSLSLAYEVADSFQLAIEATRKIIAIDSTHIAAHGNMADMLDWQGRYEEALIYAKKQLDLILASHDERGLESALEGVGRLYHYLNQPQLAEEYLRRSLQIDPYNRDASVFLAEVMLLEGKTAEAENILVEAMGKPLKNKALASLLVWQARLCAFQGRFVDAVGLLNQASVTDTSSAIPFAIEKAKIFLELGEADLIADDLKNITALHSIDELASDKRFTYLTFLYAMALNDTKSMREIYEQQVENSAAGQPSSWAALIHLAEKHYEQASVLLREQINSEPAFAMGNQCANCYTLAKLLEQQGDYGEAITVCLHGLKTRHIIGSIDRAIHFPKLLALVSDLYERTGQTKESKRYVDQFLTYRANADPNIPLLHEMQERRSRLSQSDVSAKTTNTIAPAPSPH